MNISDLQLQKIIERYLGRLLASMPEPKPEREVLQAHYQNAIREGIDFLKAQYPSRDLNLAGMGAEQEEAFAEWKGQFNLVSQFLDASIVAGEVGAVTLADKTQLTEFSSHFIRSQLPQDGNLQIYSDPSTLGVQEKYTKGILTSNHWLTDKDLKRTLEKLNVKTRVSILPFDVTTLGASLHFSRRDAESRPEAERNSPYTIPLLLNPGSTVTSQGNHWIAAKVHVNPLTGFVSYSIDDSFSLNPEQKASYKRKIEAAIKFEDATHKAFTNFEIVSEANQHLVPDEPPMAVSTITGHGSQEDGYSCGYRALHQLLQDEKVRGLDNITAREFAELDARDSHTLVEAVYTHQLEELAVPHDVYTILARGDERFEQAVTRTTEAVKVDKTKLTTFISNIPLEVRPNLGGKVLDDVENIVGSYQPSLEVLSFPSRKSEELNDIQYEVFFSKLDDVVKESGIPVPNLYLTHCDTQALQGLNAFFDLKRQAPFNHLLMDIEKDASENPEMFKAKFISHLKFVLLNVSSTKVTKLTLNDKHNLFTETEFSQLIDFVKEAKVSVDIFLPENFRTSVLQKEMDELVALNRRGRNAKLLAGEREEEQPDVTTKPLQKRSRLKFDPSANVVTDVQLQERVTGTVVLAKKGLAESKESKATAMTRVYKPMDMEYAIKYPYRFVYPDEHPKAGAFIPQTKHDKRGYTDELLEVHVYPETHTKKGLIIPEDELQTIPGAVKALTYCNPTTKKPTRGGEIIINPQQVDSFYALRELRGGISKARLVNGWHSFLSNIVKGPLKGSEEKSPLGGVVVYGNKTFSGVSEEALQALFKHEKHLSGGINRNQLPQGFIAVPTAEGEVLHYDKSSPPSNAIAPKLRDALLSEAMGIDTTRVLVGLESTDKRIKSMWKTLDSAKKYDRENHERFRTYLPLLLSLSDEQLDTVIALCTIEPTDIDYKKMAFVFKHMDEAKQLYMDPYDEKAFISTVWLEKIFPDEVNREAYIELAHSVKPSLASHHALLEIIAPSGEENELTKRILSFKLNDSQLNGLLRLYDKYGIEGVEKVIGTWENINRMKGIELADLPCITQYIDGYEEMMLSEESLLSAVNTIQGFPNEKRQWWNRLYAAHEPKDDKLEDLVDAFNTFSNRLTSHGVDFYDLSGKETKSLFTGAGNLPATLGRITSILNLCSKEDKAYQWAGMSEIDLSSTGALLAMMPGKAHDSQCGFVLPEMMLTPEEARETCPFDICRENWGGISSGKERKHVFQNFFNFIAHQKHRLPLSFYTHVQDRLEQKRGKGDGRYSDETCDRLYAIIAHTTTGDKLRLFDLDEEKAQKCVHGIFESLDKISGPTEGITKKVQDTAVESMFNLGNLPSLEGLEQIIKLSTTPFHSIGKVDLARAALGGGRLINESEKLTALNEKVKAVLKVSGNAFYTGMKSYTEADYGRVFDLGKKTEHSLYEEHINVCEAFEEHEIKEVSSYFNSAVTKLFVPLISTFAIKSEDVPSLVAAYKYLFTEKIQNYVYPRGHEKEGEPIKVSDDPHDGHELDVVLIGTEKGEAGRAIPMHDSNGRLKLTYFYPDDYEDPEKRGTEIPPKWTARLSEEGVPGTEEREVEGVLEKVYFYPDDHSDLAGKPVPLGEIAPLNAILKAVYCYPPEHQQARKVIPGSIAVKISKVNAVRETPEGKAIAAFKHLLVHQRGYPAGHVKAGEGCDYVVAKSVRSNPFRQAFIEYSNQLFLNITERDEVLDSKKLERILYELGEVIDARVFKMEAEKQKSLETLKAKQTSLTLEYAAWDAQLIPIEGEYKPKIKVLQAQEKAARSGGDEASANIIEKELKELKAAFDEAKKDVAGEGSACLKRLHDVGAEIEEMPDALLKKHQEENAKAINLVMEEALGKYYPTGYFEVLAAGKLKLDIQSKLDACFRDESLKKKMNLLLVKYPLAKDEEKIRMITRVSGLLKDLSTSETKELFNMLLVDGLHEKKADDFSDLLTTIHTYGVSNFTYFMQAALKFQGLHGLENISEKATYFLAKGQPSLRQNASDEPSEFDFVDLMIELILSGKKDELQAEAISIESTPQHAKAYQALIDAINATPLNRVDIEQALEQLEPYDQAMASNASITAFLEHLDEIEKGIEERYTVREARDEEVDGTSLAAGFFRWGAGLFNTSSSYGKDIVHHEAEYGTRPITLRQGIVEAASRAVKEQQQGTLSYDDALAKTLSHIHKLNRKYPGAKAQILKHSQHYLTLSEGEQDQFQIKQTQAAINLIYEEFLALDDQNLVLSLCEYFDEIGSEESEFDFADLLGFFKQANEKVLSHAQKKQILEAITCTLNNGYPCKKEMLQTLLHKCSDEKKEVGSNKTNGEIYSELLSIAFKSAPFPEFTTIDAWFEKIKSSTYDSDAVRTEAMHVNYNEFSKSPVAREAGVNGFKLDEAKTQSKLMRGLDYSEGELEAIREAVEDVRDLDIQTILQEINRIKENNPAERAALRANPDRLVALMAELLYRTKGLPAEGEGEERKFGRSFEINTTQYLAIHSMLKAGGHVTNQIGTGEGKSRIMMISMACQFALGNTVDFVTADVSLALRDYLEYQSFFKAMGAETNIITSDTDASQYRRGGINFSDPSNLSLFRNKARTEGRGELVIEKDETRRALMLDEADKTYFDSYDTRYNYSAEADPSIKGMEWVYEHMVKFFLDVENQTLFKTDADACNKKFMTFMKGELSDSPERMARLQYNKKFTDKPVISRTQLESWQRSAITALHLKLGEHFVIKENVNIVTKHGRKRVSKALLLSGARASDSAMFSFGVHQCLHARLNLIKTLGKTSKDNELEPVIRQLQEDGLLTLENLFHIDGETQIIYSSNADSLLDEYAEGELIAVSGTTGSVLEREEAAEAYGLRKDHSRSNMTFLAMSRHKKLERVDSPVMLANDHEAHHEKILKAVLEAIKHNEPVLLVCENDNESADVYRFLQGRLSLEQKQALTRISANTELKDELSHVKKKAGKRGAITVTTAMLGRGTDIKLHAGVAGLNVIATYLPRVRDYWQIVGRAGRFGAKGRSQMILDKGRLGVLIKNYLGKEKYARYRNAYDGLAKILYEVQSDIDTLKQEHAGTLALLQQRGEKGAEKIENKQFASDLGRLNKELKKRKKELSKLDKVTLPRELYTATKDYLKHIQERMDKREQRQRVVKGVVESFRRGLTQQFFESFKPVLDAIDGNSIDNILRPWQKFVDQIDKEWSEAVHDIQSELVKEPVEVAAIKRLLADYEESVETAWSTMRERYKSQIASGKLILPDGVDDVDIILPAMVRGKLEISKGKEKYFTVDGVREFKVPVVKKFNPAYVGRAVVYTGLFTRVKSFFKNIASAYRGDSPWFPNFKAWRKGYMSSAQFLLPSFSTLSPVESEVSDISNHDAPRVVDADQVEVDVLEDSHQRMANKGLVAGYLGNERGQPIDKLLDARKTTPVLPSTAVPVSPTEEVLPEGDSKGHHPHR